MSMFAQFGNKVSNGNGVGGKTEYSLNEILAIVHMVSVAGLDKKMVSEITGRSVHSLNYKIFEGKTTINGKTQVRSIRKHFYADPTSATNNEQVDWETAVKSLFKEYGAEYQGEGDIEARIEEYKKSLENK